MTDLAVRPMRRAAATTRELVVCCSSACIVRERNQLTAPLATGSYILPSYRIVELLDGPVTEFVTPTMLETRVYEHRYTAVRTCVNVVLNERQKLLITRQMRPGSGVLT